MSERTTKQEVLDIIEQYIGEGDGWTIIINLPCLLRIAFEQKGEEWIKHEIWNHVRDS